MLRLENIKKEYKVADTRVEALKGINLAFRKNEFVSILGPSGCGKTTTLNIIGGLDSYTSGDLFINGRSTKDFKSQDWDVYRNHRVGFIFQSYNLIPHETILENVALALTIAGYSKIEREKKAREALDKVGLKGQYNKKPNQLSGGQCQRVAIARALVNEPEILLADEPTGALDTKTSVQIMDLIKEISRDKLVIMVTHNPELAEHYSTRIIRLLDGEVQDDSNPYSFDEEKTETFAPIKDEKAKMSWWTSFKLSSKNLWSKKKRTILVSVAGSIGIIGVSSVLSISTGVNDYITSMQDDMLSGNPIKVSESSYDLSSIMSLMTVEQKKQVYEGIANKVNIQYLIDQIMETIGKTEKVTVSNVISDDYINFVKDMPKSYYADITLRYGYQMDNNIYTDFNAVTGSSLEKDKRIYTEGNSIMSLSSILEHYQAVLGQVQGFDSKSSSYLTGLVNSISQLPASANYIKTQYDLLNSDTFVGHFPEKEDELLLVLDKDEAATDLVLAQLGLLSEQEFVSIAKNSRAIAQGEKDASHANDKKAIDYSDIVGHSLYYVPNSVAYTQNGTYNVERNGITQQLPKFNYNYILTNEMKNMSGVKKLTITGIVKPKENVNYGSLKTGFYYTGALAVKHYQNTRNEVNGLIEDLNELKGKDANEIARIFKEKMYAKIATNEVPFSAFIDFVGSIYNGDTNPAVTFEYDFYNFTTEKMDRQIGYVGSVNQTMSAISSMLPEEYKQQASALTMKTISARMIGDVESPSSINIYPNSFDEKNKVTDYLDRWNNEKNITLSNGIVVTPTSKVTYTDNVGVIIGMVRTLISIVTNALIAFTALSLVVSCFMIAIITYVSVMERVKEIGVIRSLGGRKKDVTHLFNAETFIIGAASGIFGLFVTGIIGLGFNVIMRNMAGVSNISTLYWYHIVIMMLLSIGLTVISGALPARSAAKQDPVDALRSE